MQVPLRYIIIICAGAYFAMAAACGPPFKAANPFGESYDGRHNNPSGDYVEPPISSSSNLLENPGFEKGIEDWEDWGASQGSYPGYAGGRALLIGPDAGGTGQEVIYRVKPGATYQIKVYGRLGDRSDDALFGIRFFGLGNQPMGEMNRTITSTSYQLYTLDVKIPYGVSSAKVYAIKTNDSTTTAEFDDFSMRMLAPPPLPPTRPAVGNPEGLAPSGPTGDWTLVFNESFDGPLNNAHWNSGMWFNSTINEELQAYRPENLIFSGGRLSLKAENRSTVTTWGEAMNYASAAIHTRNKMTFTFGAVEARIKAPSGRGLMPLFQLLPNMKRSPPDMTIFRLLGHQPNQAQFNFKYFDWDGIGRIITGTTMSDDYSADFHTYTLEWAPDSIKFFVDGVQKGSYKGESVPRDPAFLLLNLAVGGTEPGSPDASTAFPQTLTVDYVRIWQRP